MTLLLRWFFPNLLKEYSNDTVDYQEIKISPRDNEESECENKSYNQTKSNLIDDESNYTILIHNDDETIQTTTLAEYVSSTVTTSRGQSLDVATEGQSLGVATEGQSLDVATEGQSLDVATDGQSLDVATEGQSLDVATEGQSLDVATDGQSLDVATDGQSLDVATEGTSLVISDGVALCNDGLLSPVLSMMESNRGCLEDCVIPTIESTDQSDISVELDGKSECPTEASCEPTHGGLLIVLGDSKVPDGVVAPANSPTDESQLNSIVVDLKDVINYKFHTVDSAAILLLKKYSRSELIEKCKCLGIAHNGSKKILSNRIAKLMCT